MVIETDDLIESRNLTIWRGENLLLDNVNLVVRRGSVVQVHGSNGSGKTTLLRALIGLAEFDDGDILWCGSSIRERRSEFHSELVYLGHKAGISGGLTPYENLLAICPELTKGPESKTAIRARIVDVLSELGIADRIDLPSAALSAGQQRRVSLARLRLQQAILWVLDEPLTSLDSNGYVWVKNEIQRHALAGGSVLLTTHQAMTFEKVPVQTVTLAAEA